MARLRSPNFPALTLEDALKSVASLYSRVRKTTVDREVAAKELGYSGLTGWSLKVLGALNQYGLIDNVGKGQCRVTDLAERALHGFPDAEKKGAIQEAARTPPLFQAIFEQFGEGFHSQHAIRSFLLKRGFTDKGVESALDSFLATQKFAEFGKASESNGEGSPDTPSSVATLSGGEPEYELVRSKIVASASEPRYREIRVGPASQAIFRNQPLEFSLTSRGLSITGRTNSARDLRAFIRKLEALAALLPESDGLDQEEET